MVILPVRPGVPDQLFSTQLADVTYQIRLRWNARANGWYLDVLEASDEPIASGLRVALGAALGNLVRREPFLSGTIVAVDLSGQDREPGLDDFGDGARVELRYLDREDLATALLSFGAA